MFIAVVIQRVPFAFSGFTFDVQWSFLLLFSLVFVILFSLLFRYRKSVQKIYIDYPILCSILPTRSKKRYWLRVVLLVLSWSLIVIAFMRPRIILEKREQEIKQEATQETQSLIEGETGFFKPDIDEYIFVLDVSRSITTNDSNDSSSRLDRAKDVVRTLLETIGGVNV